MAGRGAEQEESKPIHGIDLGTYYTWLRKKLENLSAAPDELDHGCRETRDFASHVRVSYNIFLSAHHGSGQARVFIMYPRRRWLGCAYQAAEPKYPCQVQKSMNFTYTKIIIMLRLENFSNFYPSLYLL